MERPSPEGDATIDAWLRGVAAPGGEHAVAGWEALAAARELDSRGYSDSARRCIEKAVEFWERAELEGETIAERLPTSQLAFADALRRVGRFEEAQRCCHRGLSGRPRGEIRSLLEFELELIGRRDAKAHSVDEVIRRRG